MVSDALGRLTLLPRGRARRVVESMLPLADVCPTQASALISLCRKCVARVENKGRLLALHAVTCILAWNARRARSGKREGCLDQDGMQEDLVGMFRRAFESGLQIVRSARDQLRGVRVSVRIRVVVVGASRVSTCGWDCTFLDDGEKWEGGLKMH